MVFSTLVMRFDMSSFTEANFSTEAFKMRSTWNVVDGEAEWNIISWMARLAG